MTVSSLRKSLADHQSWVIALVAIGLITAILTFETLSGLPASVRSAPVYGPLQTIQASSSRSTTYTESSRSSVKRRVYSRKALRSSKMPARTDGSSTGQQ